MSIEKVKTYAIVILGVLMLSFGAFGAKMFYDLEAEKIKLTAKDAQIQRLDTKLGIAESQLTDVKTLNRKYKKEIDAFPEELKKKIDEYDLKLKSRDKTIASLKNKIRGGTTTVTVGGPRETETEVVVENTNTETVVTVDNSTCPKPEEMVIGYAWKDDLGRFHLVDPDIFVEGNEEFTAEQHLVVVGHVFYGKEGQLQVKKIEIREVVPDGVDDNGEPIYKPIKGSEIKLVDAEFEYTNNLPVKQKGLLDVFTLRPFASFDTAITPGLGVEWVNLGRLIDYANVGFNTKLAFDLSDPLGGSLQSSRMGVGLNYQLIPPFIDTNLAIGVGLSMPFNHLGSLNHLTFTVDAIFYLTPDLNPFSSKYSN